MMAYWKLLTYYRVVDDYIANQIRDNPQFADNWGKDNLPFPEQLTLYVECEKFCDGGKDCPPSQVCEETFNIWTISLKVLSGPAIVHEGLSGVPTFGGAPVPGGVELEGKKEVEQKVIVTCGCRCM